MSEDTSNLVEKYKDASWVLDGKEYVMTGRVAAKIAGTREKTLLELVPFGVDPSNKDYAKWVDIKELFLVK